MTNELERLQHLGDTMATAIDNLIEVNAQTPEPHPDDLSDAFKSLQAARHYWRKARGQG